MVFLRLNWFAVLFVYEGYACYMSSIAGRFPLKLGSIYLVFNVIKNWLIMIHNMRVGFS